MEITIERVRKVDKHFVEAFARLMPQLSEDSPAPSLSELQQIVRNDDIFLLVAKEGEIIVGTTTLVTFHILSGRRAWIEDVVVDSSARGKGVGRLLVSHALHIAAKKEIDKVDLTSRDWRLAANKLYQSMNFEKRETNVYRLKQNGTNR